MVDRPTFQTGGRQVASREVFQPETKVAGHSFDLANGAKMTFPGISNMDAVYADHDIPPGCSRKLFTLTLKKATGYVTVRNKRTGALLAVLSAGGSTSGYRDETSDDLEIENLTTSNLSTAAGTEDAAVSESFYTRKQA